MHIHPGQSHWAMCLYTHPINCNSFVSIQWHSSGFILLHLPHFKEIMFIWEWLLIWKMVKLYYFLVPIATHPFVQSKGGNFIHSYGFFWTIGNGQIFPQNIRWRKSDPANKHIHWDLFCWCCCIHCFEHNFLHKVDWKSHQKQFPFVVDYNHVPCAIAPFPFVAEMIVHFEMACLWLNPLPNILQFISRLHILWHQLIIVINLQTISLKIHQVIKSKCNFFHHSPHAQSIHGCLHSSHLVPCHSIQIYEQQQAIWRLHWRRYDHHDMFNFSFSQQYSIPIKPFPI